MTTKAQAEVAKLMAEANYYDRESDKLELEISDLSRRFAYKDGLAVNHRIFDFWHPVHDASVAVAVDCIGSWSRESLEPITLRINTPGGDIIAGLALFDFLMEVRASGIHLTTTSIGMAASMGGVLLQAGEVRTMGRNASLLIHEASYGFSGKVSEMENEAEFVKSLQTRLVAILAERSTLTQRQVTTKWRHKDWWLDATQSLALGFVDAVR